MGEFFGSIYCWLEDFFGLELANYLWGEASPDQKTNMFIGIGMAMIAVSLAFVIIYYYLINHPRLNNWWGWLIFFGINGVINFIVGWQWVLKDYYDDKMVKIDVATGKTIDLGIDYSDIIAFGVSNAINSLILFFLLSYSLKWWSHNCSRAPF